MENESLPIFNSNRYIALGFLIAAGVGSWFSMILVSNPIDEPLVPTRIQWFGLALGTFIAIAVWVRQCMTIRPYMLGES